MLGAVNVDGIKFSMDERNQLTHTIPRATHEDTCTVTKKRSVISISFLIVSVVVIGMRSSPATWTRAPHAFMHRD